MNWNSLTWLLLLCVCVLTLPACSGTAEQENVDDNRPVVIVDNYPLLYMAERLSDRELNVKLLAPEDIDPAMWNPSPEKLAEMQKAELILTNGADYSRWLSKVSIDEDKIVNTSAAAADDYIEVEGVTHQHGPEGEHTHDTTAFTTWLDFNLARQQARAVSNALLELFPEDQKKVRTHLQEEITQLESDFFSFDGRMKSLIDAAGKPNMIASHPVYQYMARRYEIPMESVHWEPEDTPTKEQWAEFDALLEKHPSKYMLWEGEPTASTQEELEKRGITVLVFDPAGNIPPQEPGAPDFVEIMDANIKRLEEATNAPHWPPN